MRTRYYWAHINDVSVDVVKALLPQAEVIVTGDCGSVWGEYHDCPHPHVLIKDPTQANLRTLERARVAYCADLKPDFGEKIRDYKWTEDTECIHREEFLIDHRTPYGRPSRES